MERRNWKAELSKAAQERAVKRQELLVQLDCTREEIRATGLDFERYDELKENQRRILAELAVLS